MTPSPGPPPLVKDRVAVHPLPQGGEGCNSSARRRDGLTHGAQMPGHRETDTIMNRRFFTLGLGGLASASQVPGAASGQPGGHPVMLDLSTLILANPEISRFRPLRRIIFYDDFDNGINGWVELQANHNGNLDDLRPGFNDLRPAQLSTCTFFDVGTHGSLNGTYSLKLATRPKPFHAAAVLKRFTYSQPCRVQVEIWFTYKPEQTFGGDAHWDGNASPTELNFGDFTLNTDICGGVGGPRYMLVLRYANTDMEGKLAQKWMYNTSLEPTTKMFRAGAAPRRKSWIIMSATSMIGARCREAISRSASMNWPPRSTGITCAGCSISAPVSMKNCRSMS